MARRDVKLLVVLLLPLILGGAALITCFPPFRPAFNFATVLDGKAYRTGWISSKELERLIKTYQIRSLVILDSPSKTRALVETASRRSVYTVTIQLRDKKHPRKEQLQELVDAIEHAPTPVLFHDSWGAYKSMLASAFYLIVREGATPSRARQAFSLWNGYIPWGPQVEATRPLERYAEWRRTTNVPDGPEAVRRWLGEGYWPQQISVDNSP